MDMCSETDSTNECSDFKSELEEEDEHGISMILADVGSQFIASLYLSSRIAVQTWWCSEVAEQPNQLSDNSAFYC